MKRLRWWGLLAIGVLVALFLVPHYVPFQPLVCVVYLGLGLGFAGLVSAIKPLRVLGLRRRAAAAVVLVAGVLVVLGGMSWPASSIHPAGPRQRIDDFLPAYAFFEFHETYAKAPPARVAEAVRAVSFADIPVAGWLMRVRAMASGHVEHPRFGSRPILDLFSQPGSGFLPLDPAGSSEIVYGMIGRPWSEEPPPQVSTPEEFQAFRTPNSVKVAFNITWREVGGGDTRVATETRIAGTDDRARRTFARYWRVIYPGSAIIRRAWLDAIVARAERDATK